MFQHRIDDGEQLVHAGRQRHLFGFAVRTQALIERQDHRIEAGCDEGAHVEDRAHLRPSAPDGAPPPQRATVAIQRKKDARSHYLN